jgi:diphthamide synthase (EF-2-diphthine--ammonia ligase)
MVENNMDAKIIKICAMGLTSKMLGKSISQLQQTFLKLEA